MDKMRNTTRQGLLAILAVTLVALAGCGPRDPNAPVVETRPASEILDDEIYKERGAPTSTIWDIFRDRGDSATVGSVNKYLWNASLEVLNFLPVQSVDPFTGVITTGYGKPPGGGREYRATIYVSDPALDARSLNLAMATRSGPVDAGTLRAVEDAILTRARQLRQQDARF
ncbi:DUF3576 domain-containing protein [Puniceibacterium sediminis]|uniref:DUF3576 domain-containing protein n=1 Tax=Puniceibacterium sediminis TaxID=1608407 RepID=A0A238Y380_9RHOB|nr:DUF3576 domain-containing protein [Puniceibacterium sediminis]SNR65587.1 protein of unknown function [Puniceibacterium sediminis]